MKSEKGITVEGRRYCGREKQRRQTECEKLIMN